MRLISPLKTKKALFMVFIQVANILNYLSVYQSRVNYLRQQKDIEQEQKDIQQELAQ